MIIEAKVIGSGITAEDYLRQEVERGHPDYVLSRSDLVEILRCPHRWRAGYKLDSSEARDRGSLWDCLLLDRPNFANRYAVTPETYPAPAHHPKVKKHEIELGDPLPWNANAGWCEDWLSAHKNQEVVKHDKLLEAEAAVARVMADPELAGIIEASTKQVMVVGTWDDKPTGLKVPLRALLDIVPLLDSPFARWLLDYKTTNQGGLRLWTRSVASYAYHVQAWLHTVLYVKATGQDRCEFGHIVQENYEPFHVEKRRLSVEFMALGGVIARNALGLYCQCMRTEQMLRDSKAPDGSVVVWPGYPGKVILNGWQLVEPEPWMQTEAMETMPELVVPPESFVPNPNDVPIP